MRLKIILVLFGLLIFNCKGFAQVKSEDETPVYNQTTKVEEFGDIPKADFIPKLEKFVNALKSHQDSQGYIFYYGSFNEPLFRQTLYYNKRRLTEFENHLRDCCTGLSIQTFHAGLREKRTIELWFIPKGGEFPKPSGEREFQRKLLYRFDLLETEIILLKNDVKFSSDTGLIESKLVLENKTDLEDMLQVANKVLNDDESKRIVLIYYLNEKEFGVEESRRVFEDSLNVKATAIDLDVRRLKIVYGGFRCFSEAESWAISLNEIEPEAMPDEKNKCLRIN